MDDALDLIRKSEFGNGACIFTQNQFYSFIVQIVIDGSCSIAPCAYTGY